MGEAAPAVDTIANRWKPIALMALALFWVGFPYLLIGFTHSYLMLLLCMSMVGIGNNLWHPTAIPTLAQQYVQSESVNTTARGDPMRMNVGSCSVRGSAPQSRRDPSVRWPDDRPAKPALGAHACGCEKWVG